ncbi:MAG: protein kinase [Acidimicrobiales bacterium]|nr:protein kinase [Acidimicrobiales bacterium]
MTGDGTLVAGRRVADRYRLVAQRSADEWDAVDETLRRNVVVHLLPPSAEAHDKAHFAAEARALAGLPHRNVVATYDTGVDSDGASYRVDELPDGEPLDPTGVDDDQRVSFATQLARGIAEAHARGLLHGALTSGSVLVHEDGRVKVCGLHLPVEPATDAERRADIDAVVNLVAALAPARPHPLREMAIGWRGADPPASVADIVTALVALPDDDAVPLVDPDPTPVAGVARAKRRVPVGALFGVAIVVVVGIVVALLLPGGGLRDDVSGPVRALKVASSSFDPEATPPTENEDEAPLAVDGNPASVWRTERYRRANFANLKDGVGLVLRSEEGVAVFDALRVRTPQAGWTYAVYVAAAPAAALTGWGEPIASGEAGAADFSIPLNNAEGGAVLLWITEPGPGNQTRIAELDVTGRV